MSVPRGYAVIVGISAYSSSEITPLRFGESDAEAFSRAIIASEGGAFPAENVRLLLGRDATLARIRHAVEEWLPSIAHQSDLSREWACSAGVPAHNLTLAAYVTLPARVNLTLTDTWHGATPFNVTSGRDPRGIGLFTDRGGRTRNSGLAPGGSFMTLYLSRQFSIGRRLPRRVASRWAYK